MCFAIRAFRSVTAVHKEFSARSQHSPNSGCGSVDKGDYLLSILVRKFGGEATEVAIGNHLLRVIGEFVSKQEIFVRLRRDTKALQARGLISTEQISIDNHVIRLTDSGAQILTSDFWQRLRSVGDLDDYNC